MAKAIFWFSFALIAYVYAGYPMLLVLWARLRGRPLPTGKRPTNLPGVSIILAVRNEGRRLAARLDNLLEVDYPGIGPVKSANNPIKLSDAPVSVRRKSPGVGEHTVEIMREVGYSDAEIAALREAKAIAGT